MIDLTDTMPLGGGIHTKRGAVISHRVLTGLRAARRRLTFDLVITSGQRGPEDQAKAWATKIALGYTLQDFRNLYARDDLVDEVWQGGTGVLEMAATFQAQINRGDYITRHFFPDACDLRTRINPQGEVDEAIIQQMVWALQIEGARAIVENRPPHIHVEFSRETDRREPAQPGGARPSNIEDPPARTFSVRGSRTRDG